MANPIENFIAPLNLLGLVQNTAPFLFPLPSSAGLTPRLIERDGSPLGYLELLAGAESLERSELEDDDLREDYFALCLACHHATVATYVPTDVDAKIRGLLWRHRNKESLRRMFLFAINALNWSIDGISKRATEVAGVGPVSGHNGEQLSVLAAALGAFLRVEDAEAAGQAASAIHGELEREVEEFRHALATKGCELDVLRLAATLTHNVGDLDQGISFWPTGPAHQEAKARFGRLAHENTAAFGGIFQKAAAIYKRAMSSEGHRNYPLRQVKALRCSADLLLPLSPFLDDWGAMVAKHPALTMADRAEVMTALIHGCTSIPNQRGYFRALHGMSEALGGSVERVIALAPARTRGQWKDGTLRKQVSVARGSFESMMKKMIGI